MSAELRYSAILHAVVDSGRTVYARSGSKGLALCPFHQEKTPSFMLDAKSERFHCYGCGISGSVQEFRELIAEVSRR